MSGLRYAELFAGAGGLSIGLEMAGWEAFAHAEIEPHACAVLRKHWPDCRLDGDVSALHGADYAGVTLVSGGSPCQDLSVAGKRSGMTEGSGTRSSLYFEQVRIWQESGAPYFLWENVLGAFSSNSGRDFAAVLSALVGAAVPVPDDGWRSAGVASGPTGVAAWRVLDCQFFGPPQRRRRVFVLGARAGGVDPAEVLALSEGVLRDTPSRGEAREGLAADAVGGAGGAGELEPGGIDGRGGRGGVETFQNTGHGFWNQTPVAQSVRTPGGSGSLEANLALAVNISNGAATLDPVMGTLDTDGASTTAIGNQTRGGKPGQGYPAVLQVVAIDMRNATRTTEKDEQNRQGSGIGEVDAASPTLTGLFTPAVLAFRTDQEPEVSRGDVCHTLDTGGGAIGSQTRGVGLRPASTGAIGMDAEYNASDRVMGPLDIGSKSGGGRPTAVISFQPGNLMRRAGANPSEEAFPTLGSETQGDQAPHVVAFAQNQRGELRTSPIAPQLTTGGGKPGEGYPAVLTFVERGREGGKNVEVGDGGVVNALMTQTGQSYADNVLTYDARGNGDGATVNTMAGDHQNRVTDYTAIVLRNREGKPGGGKGPLLSAERQRTLGTQNDQVVFTAPPETYRMVAFGEYADDGLASAIKARDGKDATDHEVGRVGVPRRLMPIECERLMGWPDSHTALGIDEQGREYALSDTARYRLCGNGVAAPVAAWVGFRLQNAITRMPHMQKNLD